jgi:hypothetical protein
MIWIRTTARKVVPCDAEPVHFTPGGRDRLVTEDGRVVSGTIDPKGPEKGYVSHFATCPVGDRFRGGNV